LTGAPTRVGILGGGQLARMLTQAGHRLGLDITVLEVFADSPAEQVGAHAVVGDWSDPETRARFAAQVDLITLENEFVDHRALTAFEALGRPVRPGPAALAIVQDKLRQKQALAAAGLPVPPFRPVAEAADLRSAGREYGWPLVLKARRLGYDGKGNATVGGAADGAVALARLGRGDPEALYVESFYPFRHELAVLVVRGRDGATVAYGPVLTIQEDHICRFVLAPAALEARTAARAVEVAVGAVEAVGAVGVVGVELFLGEDGEILVNELAPRPHNSGHYTLDACAISQFENHWRAVLGWPLGDPALLSPVAMANLLGARDGLATPTGLDAALALPGVHVHIYGKRDVRRGRKMGHLNALAPTPEEALARARRAAEAIVF
jgi:5-(carboxyamino)imidazole ribonucleotide synthase